MLQNLPLGRSTFSALRAGDSIYVDKTSLVYELAKNDSKVLLIRPRRFGKSLLASIFESLFKYGLRDFKEAIITRGGVKVKEVNPSTMESKLVQGLYFAGEVLDLDALTGGFNLQIAWSTAYAAGSNIW